MGRQIPININSKYGMLTVMKRDGSTEGGHAMYLCKCDCGTIKRIYGVGLNNKRTVSCGCKRRSLGGKNKTHGLTKTRIYSIWSGMKARCLNRRDDAYKYYGGRGIAICERWLSFENFLLDMGKEHTIGLTLERIDNNGNYEPSNVKWATLVEQANNKRNNRIIIVDGVTKTLSEYSKFSGIKVTTIHNRIKSGWSNKDAVTIPTKKTTICSIEGN